MMVAQDGYDPDFDSTFGRTESPDVHAARSALLEAQTGSLATDAAIEESRDIMATLRQIREKNHFAEKIRKIIQNTPPGAPS